MRISDWSSDVCSSDLPETLQPFPRTTVTAMCWSMKAKRIAASLPSVVPLAAIAIIPTSICIYLRGKDTAGRMEARFNYSTGFRSEEHTSELQSLMRISYAVFCLTKKNHLTKQHTHN